MCKKYHHRNLFVKIRISIGTLAQICVIPVMWMQIFHRGTLKTSLVWERKGDKIKRIKWSFARSNLDYKIATHLLYKIRQTPLQSIQWCNDRIGKKEKLFSWHCKKKKKKNPFTILRCVLRKQKFFLFFSY